MIYAISMDEWTMIGVIVGIFGVVVAIVIPAIQQKLHDRLKFGIIVKGSLESGPFWSTYPGEVVKPYMRFTIRAKIINKSRFPVFIKKAGLVDREGHYSLTFISKKPIELQPGNSFDGEIDMAAPVPTIEYAQGFFKLEASILEGICNKDSYFEIVTSDDRVFHTWARDVCSNSFMGWPFMLKSQHDNLNKTQEERPK
jgi:hypothetical protein